MSSIYIQFHSASESYGMARKQLCVDNWYSDWRLNGSVALGAISRIVGSTGSLTRNDKH